MLGKMAGILLVLLFLFWWKGEQDQKKDQEKLWKRLDDEWGRPNRTEYSDKIWENISYYDGCCEERTERVDSITWNDLNFSEIFKQMNHTGTSAGESILYHLLRTPVYEEEELSRREQMIRGVYSQEKERRELEAALFEIGKYDTFSVYEYLLKIRELKPFSKLPHLFCAGLLCVGVVLIPFLPLWYLLVFLGILLFNTFFYFHEKGKHIRDITLFHFILHMLNGCERIGMLRIPGMEQEISMIREQTEKFRAYKRFHFLVAGGSSMSGSVWDSLFDYIRILFHLDLLKISTMVREVHRYEKELLLLYEEVGMVDAMLSVASFRTGMQKLSIPEFLASGDPGEEEEPERLCVKGLYHPLVKNPVTNDLRMTRSILLTGSNASGKSTFLKAIAVNIILAQTIHTVLAEKYRAPFYRVFSSMALRDDILASESYFMVEIKSLKRLFDKERTSDIPIFCFVDEILRGTNTVERVAASSMLLEVLAQKNAVCMAATHDIELTYLLEGWYENYHFEERVEKGDVLFDYLIKSGRTKSRNAIVLMEGLGFEQTITRQAKERAERFLCDGVWEV